MLETTATTRNAWLLADDARLIAECQLDRYRASGPGGQHRNRTESAIRLTHRPTGIVVTATERRSQHENRAKAADRLRQAIALQVRCPLEPDTFQPPEDLAGTTRSGRVTVGKRDPRHLLLIAYILDALAAFAGRAADAARLFDLTTSQLVALLRDDPKRLAAANAIRAAAGLDPLR